MASKAELSHPANQFGSDKEYLEWLRTRPSCIDGSFNHGLNGSGRNIACHVRRANNSGTGFKPPYSAVPMTDVQHKLQSCRGEAAVLTAYVGAPVTVKKAKWWFDRKAKQYLEQWIKIKKKEMRDAERNRSDKYKN